MRTPPADQLRLEAEWYSAALNTWAVQLQRNGHLAEAGRRFEQALALNPANFIARINLSANHDLIAGHPIAFDSSAGIIGQIKDTRQALNIVTRCGLADDPFFCCLLGSIYTHQELEHQAVEQLERAWQLSPSAFAPGLLLAQLYAANGRSQPLRHTLDQLETLAAQRPPNPVLAARLAQFETRMQSLPAAGIPKPAPTPADRQLQASLSRGDLNDALNVVNRQLAQTPDNLKARVNQAGLYLLLGQLTNGLNTLNQVLATTNLPLARLDRAGVWLKLGNLAAAERDFQAVEQSGAAPFQANYGLARVAEARHDTNRTIFYLDHCLTCAPDSTTREKVGSTLHQLSLSSH